MVITEATGVSFWFAALAETVLANVIPKSKPRPGGLCNGGRYSHCSGRHLHSIRSDGTRSTHQMSVNTEL